MNQLMMMKNQLDTRELMLLDSEVKNRGKNMLVAYVLWYFLGMFGAHRFYMGNTGSAVAQLVLTISVIGLLVTSIWWIVDAFLLHTKVKEHNALLEYNLLNQILTNRGNPPNFGSYSG